MAYCSTHHVEWEGKTGVVFCPVCMAEIEIQALKKHVVALYCNVSPEMQAMFRASISNNLSEHIAAETLELHVEMKGLLFNNPGKKK